MASTQATQSSWEGSNLIFGEKKLSDSLIGPVCSRAKRRCVKTFQAIRPSVSSIPPGSPSARDAKSGEVFRVEDEGESEAAPGLDGPSRKKRSNHHSTAITPECEDDEVRHRRKRRRLNQARYRCKQQARALQLELDVNVLRQEIRRLKRVHRDFVLDATANQNSGTLVTKMFVLLETAFRFPWNMRTLDVQETSMPLSTAFSGDVQVGDVFGKNALEEQLRCLWRYFGDPGIQLQRVEAVSPGILTATAKVNLTLSEFTLRNVVTRSGRSASGRLKRKPFVGQRLQCKCLSTFLFDEKSSRVVRVDTKIDLAGPLLRVLGSLERVVAVLGPESDRRC